MEKRGSAPSHNASVSNRKAEDPSVWKELFRILGDAPNHLADIDHDVDDIVDILLSHS